MTRLSRDKTVMTLAILAVVTGKAWSILAYGPLLLGDNSAFIAAADQILAGPAWLSDAGLNTGPTPPTLWRPIGYSLVIAGAKALAGENWGLALAFLQGALSLLAGLMLAGFCRLAGLSVLTTAAVFVMYEWSVPLSTDAVLMEDALTGALGMSAVLLILRPLVKGNPPSPAALLGAGMLAALSFLIRDVYHFVMPVLAAGLFAAFAFRKRWRMAAVGAIALAAPVFAAATALQAWNEYRTGTAVTTTAGQTAYLYATLRAAKYDLDVIGGPTIVEAVLREAPGDFEYGDTRIANAVLFERYGMNAIEQLMAAESLFWRSAAAHPAAFLRASLERLRVIQQGTLFAGPVTRIDDLDWWAGAATERGFRVGWRRDAQIFLASWNIADLTPAVFLHLALRTVIRAAGLALLAVFLIGTPLLWLFLRKRLKGPADAALVAWMLYGLWVCLYIPVSFEVRYLSPVIGPAMFATALVLIHGRSLVEALKDRLWRGSRGTAR